MQLSWQIDRPQISTLYNIFYLSPMSDMYTLSPYLSREADISLCPLLLRHKEVTVLWWFFSDTRGWPPFSRSHTFTYRPPKESDRERIILMSWTMSFVQPEQSWGAIKFACGLTTSWHVFWMHRLNMVIVLTTCRDKESLRRVEEQTLHWLAVVHGHHTLIPSGIKQFQCVVIRS